MRTTLTIDDDVLVASNSLASMQKKSVGEIISALARQALHPVVPVSNKRNGIPLLPVNTGTTPVILELINQLHDELF